jgi:tetratricopeptide (TPR) repeat protein
MGRYQEAHARLHQAMPLAQQSAVPWAIAMALHGLGLVALVRAQYTEAQQYLRRSVSSLRESGQRNDESWMHAALGIAARGLGRQTQARECLCEALQASIDIRDVRMLMYALPVAALLLSDRGQVERASEIYALASCYPFVARSTWFEAVIGQEIATAAEVLAPQVFAAAQERGRARDLWATVEELLDELAENGSQRQTG